jgi:chromosome partitioning protein
MPVITLASSKGCVGKTTTALLLGAALARRKMNVALLDGDPNQPLTRWAAGGCNSPSIVSNVSADTLLSIVDKEVLQRDAVIIDLEGMASRVVGYAIARSDLTIIPMSASSLDADEAVRGVVLVRQEAQLLRRPIPYRVLFTRMNPVPTRAARALQSNIRKSGVPCFKTQIMSRAAFEATFSAKQPIYDLDPTKVNGIPAAIENVETFANEVLAILNEEARAAA